METTEKIMDIELMDSMPTGTHKVIIDTYEERQYDEYTYLDFQLIGLEGDALDRQITHGVPYPKSGKTTGKSKLGKLVQAAIPMEKGKSISKMIYCRRRSWPKSLKKVPIQRSKKSGHWRRILWQNRMMLPKRMTRPSN